MILQDAVKKETAYMAVGCAAACIVLIAAFGILHGFFPEKVPFDYKVILGAVMGFIVAVGNFFWMAVTVQKVASMENEDGARSALMTSFRFRTMGQLLWVILALVLPVFNPVAGIIPLFIPSVIIKLRGIVGSFKKS